MRKPRILVPGAIYHVTNRINNSTMALKHADIKQLFYAVIKKAKQKYDFHILQLCIMGNHVHILIKPNSKEPYELSRICQWIFSCFARIYNNINRSSGHVWGDRFHSIIINDKNHLRNVCLYINENPVRAEIVSNPLDFGFNTVSIIKKLTEKNRGWDIFEDIPQCWKKIILSLISAYTKDHKANRKVILIHTKINSKKNSKDLTFFSQKQKWCKNGALNINDKKNLGKKYDNYINEISFKNLESLKTSKTGIWAEFGFF